ncbi:MAG: PilT/PilU family type 4a pilus ATPase [Phycisphaerales bacterium]|jgi:twitching motility protein PilT|nr:PilT/PilU family type 4a pilus ATPase [Phycisphaerales bacterium]
MSSIQIDRLLDTVIRQDASDLHISVGRKPTLRLSGRLRSLDTKVLDNEDAVALMKSITPERCQQELQEHGSTDFGFAYGDRARFRVAVFRQRGNVSIALRLIPNELLSFDQIGLPEIVRELIRRPRGLFIVTGPTGSGKTTSLATMIDHINMSFDRHIVTVEDPIEYYHYHKKSVVNQREVGVDVPSFAEALRRALRQDPDVILVGEMRDLETIEAAIAAAETGHLVFATLHTTGASGTINRIIDAFPTNQQEQIRVQLSVTLLAVLSQQLLTRADKPGRVASYEFLVVTPAIANLIRENKTFRIDSAIQTGKKFGMQLLDDHLWGLFERGIIDAEEMIDKARDASELTNRIHRVGKSVGRTELDQADSAKA